MSELANQPFGHTRRDWVLAFRDALLVVVGCSALAVGVNSVRSDRIPLIAKAEYEILVPCPENVGVPNPMAANDSLLKDPRSLVIDARESEAFVQWHLEGARNQPFDWLGPPVDAEVKSVAKQVAASGSVRVIVYGDGDDPDSGQEWAKLLIGAGIKNVSFVEGGAPALNTSLPKPQNDSEPAPQQDDVGDQPDASSAESGQEGL